MGRGHARGDAVFTATRSQSAQVTIPLRPSRGQMDALADRPDELSG